MRFVLSLAVLAAIAMPASAQYGAVFARQRVIVPQFAAGGCDCGVQAQLNYGAQVFAAPAPVYQAQVYQAPVFQAPVVYQAPVVVRQRTFIPRQFAPAYGAYGVGGVGRVFGQGGGLFSSGLGGGGLNLNIGNGSINNGNVGGGLIPGAGIFRGFR